MTQPPTYDSVIIGGGPAGATAATDLAKLGRRVLLLERGGRIKPCGGAIPPQAMRDFDIPESQLVGRVSSARMIAPSGRQVDMPIKDGGYVGMVDRKTFDVWLRERAAAAGAELRTGRYTEISHDSDSTALVHFRITTDDGVERDEQVRARTIIGADGANSLVAKQHIPGADKIPHVSAYHEIIRSPEPGHPVFDASRCDVYYQGVLSPDFYAWIFPHGDTISIGMGTAHKGVSLRQAVADLRQSSGLADTETLRREGAPLPLYPLKRWDNGRDLILAGDAAGVVAPASGEGIYYAMVSGRLAAEACEKVCATDNAKALRSAQKRFMKEHGQVFWILGIMQRFWYKNDRRRERFVSICQDQDVQDLTWEAYMNKRLVRAKPLAHARIFFKNLGHLSGLARSQVA